MSFLVPALMMGSSFLKGLSQRTAARESAAAERENAVTAMVTGHFQQRGMKLDQEALLSQIRNTAAAGGGSVDYGSPLDAYLQAARETELDIIHARNSAASAARAHMTNAANLKRAGDSAMLGELLGGAADAMKFKITNAKVPEKPKVIINYGINPKNYSLDLPKFTFGSGF